MSFLDQQNGFHRNSDTLIEHIVLVKSAVTVDANPQGRTATAEGTEALGIELPEAIVKVHPHLHVLAIGADTPPTELLTTIGTVFESLEDVNHDSPFIFLS